MYERFDYFSDEDRAEAMWVQEHEPVLQKRLTQLISAEMDEYRRRGCSKADMCAVLADDVWPMVVENLPIAFDRYEAILRVEAQDDSLKTTPPQEATPPQEVQQ